MTRESTRIVLILGALAVLAVFTVAFLGKRDQLAANDYRLQALSKCEQLVIKGPCIERVERDHENCYRAFFEQRRSDVDGYARCIGLSDETFER